MLDRVVPDSVIPAALVDVLVGPGGSIPGAPGAGLSRGGASDGGGDERATQRATQKRTF